jgi:hypothetical protein
MTRYTEHKDYHGWYLVTRRMRTSQDVVFDESRPFYMHPSTDACPTSLVDPLSLLIFPNTPPASLSFSHLTLPSSMSSSESLLVV